MTEREVQIAREAYVKGCCDVWECEYGDRWLSVEMPRFEHKAEAEYPLPPAKVWRCSLHGIVKNEDVVMSHLDNGWLCGPVEEVEE